MSFLSDGAKLLAQRYKPMILEAIERMVRQERMDWDLLGPDKQYEKFQEMQRRHYEELAQWKRKYLKKLNKHHSFVQKFRALRKKMKEKAV